MDLSVTWSVERTGLESDNALKRHHKCRLQLTNDLETAYHVMCKVHTFVDYYDKMGLNSYANLIIFMFPRDG